MIIQALIAPTATVLHLPALAQDSGEGSASCEAPLDNSEDDEPPDDDDADDDQSTDDEAPGSDEGAAGDETGIDGGDYGDGGAAASDPGGTDGSGHDGDMAGGLDAAFDGAAVETFDAFSGMQSSYSGGGGGGHSPEMEHYMSDPIDLRMADKRHVQVDYLGLGAAPLRIARVYHSNLAAHPAQVTLPMGTGWRSYYDRTVQVISGTQLRLHRANGRMLDYTYNGSAWVSALPGGTLNTVAGGGWQYVNHRDQIELYGSSGKLLSLGSAGKVTTLEYSGAQLWRVSNPFGRTLIFGYDGAWRVAQIILPDGRRLNYNYDAQSNLASVTFTDNTVRQYKYENPSYPNALTGVVDESGRRRLTWGYDSLGRPNMGYYGTGINRVDAAYYGDTVVTTDARGTQRTRTFGYAGARKVLTSLQTGATADSPATGWTYSYNASGNPVQVVSRTGEVRQLSTDTRVRALSVTRAAGTATALSAQATWHPTYRKRTQSVALGITRNASIDAYGRVTALTMTGTDGVTSTVMSRVYNAQHLLQSQTDARGAVTSFTYDATGNRTSRTNALGQTTTFSNFNAHGQAGTITRPTGAVVSRSFDLRGRMVSRTAAGRTATFAYDGAGRLWHKARSDGSWVQRTYDAAGYMTSKNNHRGEVRYVARDVDGKVTARATYTASGAVASARSQQYTGQGRLKATFDASNNRTQWLYGNDGRPSGVTNPLNQTRTVQLDLLDRPTSTAQPNTTAMRQLGGPATVSTSHSYHATRATKLSTTDTVAVTTNFGPDRYNQPVSEAGVDAGNKTATRNAAGDVQSMTDARGVTFTLTRDSLGRVATVTPTGGSTTTVTYVPGRSDALPATMSDVSGSSSWGYDSAGRMLSKTQTVAGISRTLNITRDAQGRVSGATYPSGMQVAVTYNANGVSSLAVNGAALLNNVSYRPFSAVATGWTWGNGSTYSRSFDANDRIIQVSLGTVQRSYGYDAVGRITSQTDVGPSGTLTASIGYDEAGQITSYAGPQGSYAYGYDSNGNRRTQTMFGSTSTNAYAPGTNRILTSPNGNYTYNAEGHPSSDGYYSFTYEPYGRWASMNSTDYRVTRRYNGQGFRVSSLGQVNTSGGGLAALHPSAAGKSKPLKLSVAAVNVDQKAAGPAVTAAATWTTTDSRHFFHDHEGHLLGEYSLLNAVQKTEIVWFNGQPVAAMINGTLHYVFADHLGTPRALRRAGDNVEVWRWDSEPFGSTPLAA